MPTLTTPNPALVGIFRSRLLGEFRKHGQHSGRKYYENGILVPAHYDPWWWPIDPATKAEHWGLLPQHDQELQSLCEFQANGKTFPNFKGSLGAEPGCVCIIGERPSFNTIYASAVTKLYRKLRAVEDLLDLRAYLRREPTFHVTDLIKFRGTSFLDNLTKAMVETSAACVQEELRLLNPPIILLTDMAQKRLAHVLSLLPSTKQGCLSGITKHPVLITVPHWSRREPDCVWADRVSQQLREIRHERGTETI